MDQRVCEVMQKLRQQELYPPSNSKIISYKTASQTTQKMSLEELANSVGLSESRLRALFKADIGLTLTQYIRKIKMDSAADMLRNGHRKVTEIRAKLGANDDSHFVRDFKQSHGMPPTQYRKLHQRRFEGEEGDGGLSSSSPAIVLANE